MVYFCTYKRGSSSVGRASASQAEGRESESRFPLKVKPPFQGGFFVYSPANFDKIFSVVINSFTFAIVWFYVQFNGSKTNY